MSADGGRVTFYINGKSNLAIFVKTKEGLRRKFCKSQMIFSFTGHSRHEIRKPSHVERPLTLGSALLLGHVEVGDGLFKRRDRFVPLVVVVVFHA